MPFSKGDKNINRKGRTPIALGGSPNKLYGTRKWVQTTLETQRDKVEKELSKLEGKEFLSMYLKLLSYVIAPRTKQIIDITKLSNSEVQDLIDSIG